MVRFANEKGYFICENDVFALPLHPIEKLTYLAITRYAGTNNRAWPAYETLARDVSCSKRRVIDAVKNLVSCKLIEKQVRGNRSNLYLIYSPKYYCAENIFTQGAYYAPLPEIEVNDMHPDSEYGAPLNNLRVHAVHPESEPDAPAECTTFTPGVNTVHPKINNKSTKENLSLVGPQNQNERESWDQEFKTESLKMVQDAFMRKGSVISDKATIELLNKYSPKLIVTAINSTDFKVARNPLSVVKWMLAGDNYVLPLEKPPPPPLPERAQVSPAEDAHIRQMIRDTRAGLTGRAAQVV